MTSDGNFVYVNIYGGVFVVFDSALHDGNFSVIALPIFSLLCGCIMYIKR